MLRILEMTDAQIINELAGDAEIARHWLNVVREKAPTTLRTLAVDLDDMNIRGVALSVAFSYVDNDYLKLVELCAARDLGLVKHVAEVWPGMGVRQHGEQRKVQMVDAAIRGVIDEAKAQSQLSRLDEGSEHVQALFRTMLQRMQQAKYFLSNFYLNLDNGVWGHFEIALKGLVDAEGKPLTDPKTDPTKENAMLADALLEKTAKLPDAANAAIEEAVDEFIDAQEGAKPETAPRMLNGINLELLSYLLTVHENALKKNVDASFPIDPMEGSRWAFLVTRREIATIVDDLLKNGTDISAEQAVHFKEGRGMLRLNNVFVWPELSEGGDEATELQPLNG